MEYEQLWFERMWYKRHKLLFQDQWVKEFRMPPETFEFVVELVRGNIERNSITFGDAIEVEKRVAISIWRLVTEKSYRTVSKVFGKATVIKITADFVKELVRLASRFIKFLKRNYKTASAVELFKSFWSCSLPQVLGAIDGTHIEILKPHNESSMDYFSRKKEYTVNTQAVVGSNLIFLDAATGFPGSIHDTRMLRAIRLYQDAEGNIILTLFRMSLFGAAHRWGASSVYRYRLHLYP